MMEHGHEITITEDALAVSDHHPSNGQPNETPKNNETDANPDVLADDDHNVSSHGDGSDGGDESDDRALSRRSSSRHSGSSAGRSSNQLTLRFNDGLRCLRKVPFEIQVIVTLMVPVICLIAVCAEVVAPAADESRFVRKVVPVVRSTVTFEAALMAERGSMSLVLGLSRAQGNDTEATNSLTAAMAEYQTLQEATDKARQSLIDSLQDFADDELLVAARNTLDDQSMHLAVVRKLVSIQLISGTDARQMLTDIIIASNGVLRAIIKHSNVGHSYRHIVALLATRSFANHFGMVRGTGNELMAAPRDNEVWGEFKGSVRMMKESATVLLDVTFGNDRKYILDYFNSNQTTAALAMIERSLMGDRVPHETWRERTGAAVTRIDDVIIDVVDRELGKDATKAIVKQSLIMVFTVALTFACAAFIVFWQVRIARNMAKQQQHAAQVSRVVSSFVPKAFLRTMGTRSIMQIATGQHVNVATTMLFSDIRSFTNLSERMSNERLFSWLQQYFALMTRVTDRHSGTIDKLIGDAIFSFFPVPANGVRCAIDMQSVVVFLNSTLPSEHLVQLGVGLHHGVVAFGVFGDESRRTCTMVSSEVNLASRLEGLTKKYGVRIIVSDEVLQQVDCENFTHDVLNPMALAEPGQPHAHSAAAAAPASASSPPQQPMAARLRAINAAYARTTSRDGDGDGGAGRDQRDDADSDAVSHAGLAHRVLGEVAVKGSRRVVRIFEVFQADAVEVRKYKAKSRALFEEAVYLQLAGSGAEQQQRRRSAVLKEHAQEYNALRHRDSEVEEEASSVSYESAQNLSIGADYQVDAFHPNAVSKSQQQQQQPAQQAGCELPEFTASINTVVRSKSIPAGWKPQPPPCDACMELGKNGGVLKCAFHQNVTKMLSLLDECEAIANNLGVEDPVLAVKRAQFQRGGLDIFASK